MDYEGLDADDLTQVHALNAAFLGYLSGSPEMREQLPFEMQGMFDKASPVERSRVARSPFLIFSLSEHDHERWRRVFDRDQALQLFDNPEHPTASEVELVSATLAFLWQFAKQNPYAARVISGASLEWCERLADSTLVDLFRFAATTSQLLGLRFRRNTALWRKLLVAGTSAESEVRSAARITALQTLLTCPGPRHYQHVAAAACKMPAAAMRVADRRTVSNSVPRSYNTPPDESPVDKRSRKDLPKR
ncbi:MAG TPA: hypothetical protein PKK10_13320 [Woeseiaceae bacterium]|nr:hypothetical protein [Woeseiaceae bacterium]